MFGEYFLMTQRFVRKVNRIPLAELYSSENWYFVTICVSERRCIFDFVSESDGNIKVFNISTFIIDTLIEVSEFFDGIKLLDYVLMPNHLHFIVVFDGEQTSVGCKQTTLGKFVKAFKATSQKKLVELLDISENKFMIPGDFNYHKLWQKSFYDHIIRNQNDLLRIQEYIRDNPSKWELDNLNPNNNNTTNTL